MVGGVPKYNQIIFLVEKENDLPAWFTLDNLILKSIAIAKPDEREREIIAKNVLKMFEDFDSLSSEKQHEVTNFFVTQTSGMFAKEIVSIVTLALREDLSATEISEAVRRYKVGISENPWAKINKERLKNANEIISQRVIGQDKAVNKAVRSIKRAFFNLSGAQYSRYSNRPKGTLFLAGATGVGKTELAKSITELLFGSESNYIRFDMSEFSHEHADQRLIGAPPGYVGYDVGGELVNKIKQNPFSVVLFDEIEKAHPKILDIFLQILDDGRLTSGRGEVVYFSEAFIVFTSNLGIYKTQNGQRVLNVSFENDYPQVEEKVKTSIEEYFKFTINRPEILNRIGENIVVFDFIRKEYAAKIFEKMLNNILLKLEDDYKITLHITDTVKEQIKEEVTKDLNMGGRGIGNQLEEVFVNPLADLLFELMPQEGDSVQINDIRKDEAEWVLTGSL
jgi:ATP-dependent Clp protease ATP-binding subunit ClpA